jgi:RHS repeat-associated protein
VRFVVNADTGAIAQELDYSSFGEVLRDTNPGFQPFGFAGGIYDHQTKLVRFGARDYDGQVGRWVSKDPILFEGDTSNLYEYANNNPVDYIDPKGTDSYLTTRWGHVFLVVSDPDNLGGFLVYDFFPESNRSIFTSVDGVVREQRFNSPNAIPGVFIPGSYATQSPAADVSTITRARDLKNLANSGELSFSGLGSGGKSLNCWGFAGAAK